mgnify:CR=1 FL=1
MRACGGSNVSTGNTDRRTEPPLLPPLLPQLLLPPLLPAPALQQVRSRDASLQPALLLPSCHLLGCTPDVLKRSTPLHACTIATTMQLAGTPRRAAMRLHRARQQAHP